MNKDTLYSGAIVDTSGGATVTLPQVPDGRYMSILLVDNDHYSPEVFYAPGVHELPKDTKYLGVFVRTQLFNPDDPAEIALVNTPQVRWSPTQRAPIRFLRRSGNPHR